jgi:hypothetical protein
MKKLEFKSDLNNFRADVENEMTVKVHRGALGQTKGD